jgi:hypothetical protein
MIVSRSLIAAAVAAPPLWVCGCGPARPAPRCVADRLFETNELSFSIAGYADAPRSQPRLERLAFLVDGSQAALPHRIEAEAAGRPYPATIFFSAPPRASSVEAIVLIEQARRGFRMRVPFRSRHDRPPYRWLRGDEKVTDLGPVPEPAR